MAQWKVACKKCDFKGIGDELGIDQVVVRVMRNRGLETKEEMQQFINVPRSVLHSYENLLGIDTAVDILLEKIDEGMGIRIIGDYDVDGIMSTYILWKGLTIAGADVDAAIPDRMTDGYGININLIDNALKAGRDTILTCDNGIAASEAIAYAKDNGMTCVITDHHEVPYDDSTGEKHYIIPNADAVVDPKIEECVYPHRDICGAQVAYKLIEALFDALGVDESLLDELMELAGIATVCDVMPLTDENRYFVKHALKSLTHSKNTGMRALIQVCELEGKPITGHSIGFVLGPCINATGRLESAGLGLELLQAGSIEEGIAIATRLRELNNVRKQLTETGVEKAKEIIDSEGLQNNKVIVACIPELHESLAGIVAGRVREYTGKPAFILSAGEGALKGSARSIPGYHIYDAMTEIKDVFIKYGGHSMAAGFSIEEDRLEELRTRLNENCRLTDEDYEEKILIDVPMPMAYVTEDLIEQLSLLEPFGVGNEKPVFAQKDMLIKTGNIMGNGNMAKFQVYADGAGPFEAVVFRKLEQMETCVDGRYGEGTMKKLLAGEVNNMEVKLDAVYYPSINEFRGKRTVQFVLSDFR